MNLEVRCCRKGSWNVSYDTPSYNIVRAVLWNDEYFCKIRWIDGKYNWKVLDTDEEVVDSGEVSSLTDAILCCERIYHG